LKATSDVLETLYESFSDFLAGHCIDILGWPIVLHSSHENGICSAETSHHGYIFGMALQKEAVYKSLSGVTANPSGVKAYPFSSLPRCRSVVIFYYL